MDYAPDFPIRTPGLLYDVNSFVPDVSGNYVTAPVALIKTITASGATAGPVIAGFAVRSPGTPLNTGPDIFYGTLNKLLDASSVDVTGATSFSMSSTGGWSFCAYGANVLAANGKDLIRYRDITSGSNFTAIAGSPDAQVILTHENAIVALGGLTNPQGWACSDVGDFTQWSAAPNNGADSGTLYGGTGGPITAGTTWGKVAIAFKQGAMYGGVRVDEIDQAIHWETIDDQIGCVGLNAHVKTELGIIFVSKRDILLYDGSKPRSIADKVRRTFFAQVPYASVYPTLFLTHDELERNIYVWHNVGQSDAYPTRAFVYNYRSGKWGKLPTLQTNGTSFLYARAPMLGAVAPGDIVGAFSSNDLQTPQESQSNQVILQDASLSYRAAFGYVSGAGLAITRASAGKPSLTTGYFGTPTEDNTINRVLFIPELSGTDPESGTIVPVAEDATTVAGNAASVNPKGMIDKVSTGRYFQASATWPTSVKRQVITEYIPQFHKVGRGR